MQFTGLISKVLDFVNLGKVVVDAGPGILLAVALAVVASRVAQLPVLPYSTDPVALVTAEIGTDENEERDVIVRPDPGVDHANRVSRYERNIAELREKIAGLLEPIAVLAQDKAAADAEVAARTTGLEQATARVVELEAERARRTTAESLGGSRLGQELWRAGEEKKAAEAALLVALRNQTELSKELTTAQAEYERLLADFDSMRGQRLTSLGGLLTFLLDNLIGLALVGWVLGTMMSPLNRAILDRSARREIRAQRNRQVSSFSAATQLTPQQTQALSSALASYGPGYFIGRKIITQSEWDENITGYYRWAELSGNLVIPLLVLGLAFRVVDSPTDTSVFVPDGWLLAPIALFILMVSGLGDLLIFYARRLLSRQPKMRGPIYVSSFLALGAVASFFLLETEQVDWAFATTGAWLLSLIAWLRSRRAYKEYQQRQRELLLGRLEKFLKDEEACQEATSLTEVAAKTATLFKGLLDRAQENRKKVKEELLAELRECLNADPEPQDG